MTVSLHRTIQLEKPQIAAHYYIAMQHKSVPNDNRPTAWRTVFRNIGKAVQDLTVASESAEPVAEGSPAPVLLRKSAASVLPSPSNDDSEAPLPAPKGPGSRKVALALQGGGAHGALTWGVLDRLLAEPEISFEAISGSSAGALNAAALASGFLEGGPEGAQRKLETLWRKISNLSRLSVWRATPFHIMADAVSRLASPYQLNPFGLDPLRDILAELIDFERLRGPDAIRLLIAATDIASSEARLFGNEELSADVLLASACLPVLKQAVKLGDRYYWDGGFTANPPLLPLIERSSAREVLLVRVDPEEDDTLPTTPRDIETRVGRIVFNAPLRAELEQLARLRRIGAEAGPGASPLLRRVLETEIHMIGADEEMRRLDAASKLNPDWRFVSQLHGTGRAAAERWLTRDRRASARRARKARALTTAAD